MTAEKQEPQKKRQVKAGHRRITVLIEEPIYKRLEEVAEAEMREPNNLLSFLLKDQLPAILRDHVGA